uniref:Uncharacterized protein n=1 Tax=Peronospora matthiolae TaxID=2874970 RepID=A0AAV1TMK2_9STRA
MEHCNNAMDHATLIRNSCKAMAISCLAMDVSSLPLAQSASGTYDARSRLIGLFEKKILANKLFLRRRFFTTMMDECYDVMEHINKTKTLVEQLDAVGAPVSKEDLRIMLLCGLSESY